MRSLVILVVLGACTTSDGLTANESDLTTSEREAIAARIRAQFATRNIRPVPAVTIPGTAARQRALVALGQALLFDRILSDNQDVSCMTCHPPTIGTDDDRHLSMGVRGGGLGFARTNGVDIPRNAPPLFNLHALDSMFWDGRVERMPDGSYRTPAGAHLTPRMTAVFEFGAISALGMFPPTNREEMRDVVDGRFDDLARIPDHNFTAIWNALMNRLRAVPRYREMFGDAYPSWPGSRTSRIDTMTFAHASNAMAAYMIASFNLTDTPWDDFVGGNNKAFKDIPIFTKGANAPFTERDVLLGAERFLATCANCHDGPLLSNNRFHNTALAQVGPGLGDGELLDDFGRQRVVADASARCGLPGANASCRYAFRTTPLRNVALTAPYGHAGANGRFGNPQRFDEDVLEDLDDLRAFVQHYSVSPADNLRAYDVTQVEPRLRPSLRANIATVIEHIDPLFVNGSPIVDSDVHNLTAFMAALTSKSLLQRGLATDASSSFAPCDTVPDRVPSGLPIDTPDANVACDDDDDGDSD